MPLYNHVCGLWKFSGSSDSRNCWEALGMLRLWTDHCTVDNESLPIWIICFKHSKTIEVIFRGDILKIFIVEDMQILDNREKWINSNFSMDK